MKAHPLIVLIVLTACGGGGKDGPKNNITITALADSMTLRQGSQAYLGLTVERPADLGDITIVLSEPEGIYANDIVLVAGETKVVLELATSVASDLGASSLLISATADGGDGSTRVPADIAAPSPSSVDLINQALEGSAIDYPTSVLYRAYALVDDPRLPEAYRGVAGEEDLGFFVDAADPSLPAETRTALAPFLVRPADPASIWQTLAPTNPGGLTAAVVPCNVTDPGQDVQGGFKTARVQAPIRVWVQCTGNDAEDDIVLASGLSYASAMYGPMSTHMGPPVFDDVAENQPGNLDSAIDVFVVHDGGASLRSGVTQIGNGIAVATAPFAGDTSSGYILIGRSRAESAGFRSTMIHEFFHVLQKAHNRKVMWEPSALGPSTEFWWVEASATWASSHFARSLAPANVYYRFADFQQSPSSLHRSYAAGNPKMYAAFIWGFWEEHESGSPETIATSWVDLEGVSGFTAANEALDGVFDFEARFHEFAIANINEDYPRALGLDKRHRGLDSRFPEPRPRPSYADDQTVNETREFRPGVDIPPLKAAYYRYTPRGDVRKVVVHFDEITTREGLDIDGVIKSDGNWGVESYSGLAKKTFCLDRDKVEDIILVLSNHDLPITQFVLGNLRVEVTEAPCKATWSGTLRYEISSDAPAGNQHSIVTANVVLEQDETRESSPFLHFLPTGTFTLTKSGTVGGCVLQVGDYHGTLSPVPEQGELTLDPATDPVRYQATLQTPMFALHQHADCEPPQEDYDVDTPQIYSLMLVPFADGKTASEDGIHIDGTKMLGSDFHSEVFEWHLTRDVP
ncbi:MAG: hypothetical protein ACAI38_22360 [Myxococcota bacterium]